MSKVPEKPKKTIEVSDAALINMVDLVEKNKYNDAIKWIQRKATEEEQLLSRTETFDAYPADGAHAFMQVLKETYGWVEQKPIQGFWGPQPPEMLTLEVAYQKFVDVPWGTVAVPNIEGTLEIGAKNDRGVWKFSLGSTVKKKHTHLVRDLSEKTREYLKTGSIYKGQALKLEWVETEATRFTPGEKGFTTPKFMAPSGMSTRDLILPQIIYDEVDATLFSFIRNSEALKSMKVPTKRLVLGAGKYGTGKTLTATIMAELCVAHGRTFLYLQDVNHLAECIYFAQQYGPACVSGEDIDAVKDLATMDKISNTIDGIDTKQLDILFFLTTNHLDQIPEKFRRKGRSDMVIRYTPPDAEAAGRLIFKYGGVTLDSSFSEEEAVQLGVELAKVEMIPASIREVVERAKLFAIARNRRSITYGDLSKASHGVIQEVLELADKVDTKLPAHLEEVGILIREKNHAGAKSPVGAR